MTMLFKFFSRAAKMITGSNTGCNFLQWNNTATPTTNDTRGEPPLVVMGGRASSYGVSSSNFWTSKPTAQILLSAGIGSAVVTGNTMAHRVHILGVPDEDTSYVAVAHNVATRHPEALRMDAPPCRSAHGRASPRAAGACGGVQVLPSLI